jgi:hypothetical protein
MPIPDEKARAWTRPEDYWPPRRPRRSGRTTVNRFRPADAGERASETRPLLDIIPYAALMFGLAVLALGIIVLAWPGRGVSQAQPQSAPTSEVGNAPKGWMDRQ